MNLLNILSTSPHYFGGNEQKQQMRIQILILGFEGLIRTLKGPQKVSVLTGLSHKLTISTPQHQTTSASQKITSKMRCSMSVGTKNYFTSHFFLSSCNLWPLAIPESRAHNIGLRLLEYHSLNTYPIQALFVHLIT